MGRRGGFISAMNAIARASAREARRRDVAARRQAREADVAIRRSIRQRERNQREAERAHKDAQREAKQAYLEQREGEAEALNEEITEALADLAGILEHTLKVDDFISFDSLRLPRTFPPFLPARAIAAPIERPDANGHTAAVARPSTLLIWIPWVRTGYERRLAAAAVQDAAHQEQWQRTERERLRQLDHAQREHDAAKAAHLAQVEQRDQEVDRFRQAYQAGNPEAVIAYNSMVLDRSQYPDSIDIVFNLGFVLEHKELVIDYQLPSVDCVPEFVEHKYVKNRDEIDGKARKTAETRTIYRDVVASMCLRSIHEVFEADQRGQLASVVFTGSLSGIDPATGLDVERPIVSVRAKRDRFLAINLGRVDKIACLEQLGGRLSARPDEMQVVDAITPYGSIDGLLELEELPVSPRTRSAVGRR